MISNEKLLKKKEGVFYTPEGYSKKSIQLVMKAIEKVPDGNDYIILDRCAGTGNLEMQLIGLKDKNGSAIISHCIVSTYSFNEHIVLKERLGLMVRHIILNLKTCDALSEDYLMNNTIMQYISNPNCTVILYENPPYYDETSNRLFVSEGKTESYVLTEMKKEVKGVATNEMANRFIWSAFKYYLRQPTDSYIVFSPIKYWKAYNLCEKKFIEGYIFNKKHFGAVIPSAVTCCLWQNIDDVECDNINLDVYDIIDDDTVLVKEKQKVTKVYNTPAKYFDKRKNNNYIAYMNISGFNFDSSSVTLLRDKSIRGHGSCFYIYPDVFIYKLPLFCAKLYPFENWYEREIYATTSDAGENYIKDKEFLKVCLIYTCLSNKNHCLSFVKENGDIISNELCLDGDTVASRELKKYSLTTDEAELIALWNNILKAAKECANYNPNFKYGIYQINKELNTCRTKRIYNNSSLNDKLLLLRDKLKQYYFSHIREAMFKYELIK